MPIFRKNVYERLDMPHSTAHGDPWKSDTAFPEVFWWRNLLLICSSLFPIPGIGSYFPHIYLPLLAEYFFHSFLMVVLGVFLWSLFVEVPVYFFMNFAHLLPNDRSLWIQFIVYNKKNPTQKEIKKALSYKQKYENPKNGEYYAVLVTKRHYPKELRGHLAREDHLEESGRDQIKEVYGISYHKRDFSGYIVYAILIDVVLGVLGAWIGYYIWSSLGILSLRDNIDIPLVLEYALLFFTIAHLSSFWGWVFTPISFAFIFIVGAINSNQHTFSWIQYLVIFGVTFYYWIVFFRVPFSSCSWFPLVYKKRNFYYRETIKDIETNIESSDAKHKNARQKRKKRQKKTPTAIKKNIIKREYRANKSWSWWMFSSMNYDTYGYNAWFGSMILLIIIATIAINL